MTRRRPKPQALENTPYYASQELYQALFEQAAEGIFIADAQGRIVEVNRCGCEMLGYTREEMLNFSLADLISAEELARDPLRLEEVRADKSVLKERRLRTKDGRLLPVEINARRLSDGNLLGTVRDISARKRLEAQSLEGQERFRLLSESSLTGVYLIQEGRFRYVNPAMARMFGYSVEELVDRRSPLDLVHPDDHPLVAENIRRRLEAEVKEIHYEFRGLRKDGSIVHIEVHGRRIEHDSRVGVIGTLIDITDRKRAQEERLAHLRFFENMNRVNQAIQGTNDLEQMMSDVLDALLEIFGCDRAWLVYPCDPAAATWQTPMERTRPEYPGVLPVGVELPLEPVGAAVFQILLDTPGPIIFGPESPYPVPEVLTQVFRVQSFIAMAFYPKIGKPWSFGLHQCSYPRVWSPEDQRLFQEIAHRLADALSSLLAYRDLQESELRYREIFENSSDAITIAEVTQDGRFKLLDFNPAWEKMVGLKASHLAGAFLEDLTTTETTQDILENYRRCLENETPIDQERELVTPAGHWHIYTTLVPVRNASGKIYRIIGISRDITAHKQIEELRHKQEQEFRALAENSPDFITRYDRDGRAVYVNPAVERLFNIPAQKLLVQSLVDQPAPTPQWLLTIRDKVCQVLTSGVSLETEIMLTGLPLDHPVYHHLRFVPERDRQGQIIGVLTIGRDISALKQVEAQLRTSEVRYRALVESQVDLISRYLPDTTLTFANDAYCQFYGKKREELIGLSFLTMVAPEFHEAALKETESLVKEPRSIAGEYLNYTWDGRACWIHWIIQSIVDENGQVIELQATGRDITPLKQAEEEIRHLNQELEQRVSERTAELEAANKELEAFAYSVSHDLRAPLRHIDGFLELLQKRTAGALDERSQHYMTTISNSAKRMGMLIDDLLAFSRMGRYEMSKMPVDLGGLVQEIIQEFSPELHTRSIRWRIMDLPIITGDRAMLRLVLVNLLSNAVKFTRGCPQAEIEIGCQPGQEAERIFFVRDNGVGFEMAYADKLFGVFQRLHGVDEFEGTGIGLANVRRIIQRHGGRTWAEGKVNQGATFYFSLPQSI